MSASSIVDCSLRSQGNLPSIVLKGNGPVAAHLLAQRWHRELLENEITRDLGGDSPYNC